MVGPESAAGAIIFSLSVLGILYRSATTKDGRLRRAVEHFKSGSRAHEQIPEMRDTLDRVEHKVDETREQVREVDGKVEAVGEAVAEIHPEHPTVEERRDVDWSADD